MGTIRTCLSGLDERQVPYVCAVQSTFGVRLPDEVRAAKEHLPTYAYKYRFFTLGRGPVPALGVFVVFGAPFPFAISSCSELKVWAVSGAR